MNRIDRLLELARARRSAPVVVCAMPDGTEKALSIKEAISSGGRFVCTVDGSHHYDALFDALLSSDNIDFSDLPELQEPEETDD